MYFPLFISLKEKEIMIFGGGIVSQRRTKILLEFGAKVQIISPEISIELQELAKENEKLILHYRNYCPSELRQPNFVIAATDDENTNTLIFRECRHKEIPVNVASNQAQCDFFFPGIIQEGDITIGVTANGKDHKRAAKVTEQIKNLLKEEQ
ncbi:MAG: bifunctional precorrin-2 dehydrogenase/sirohydrochlorin ferrochelatase [Lachnospiraceae bacterium]